MVVEGTYGGLSGGGMGRGGVSSGGGRVSGGGSGGGGGVHILSQKVSRALELRTDTPAMLTALDALVSIPSTSDQRLSKDDKNPQESSSSTTTAAASISVGAIDSKSVRTLMDKDALNQALMFQKELGRLLHKVKDMKRSVSEVTQLVEHVQRTIEHDVIHDDDDDNNDNNIGSTSGINNDDKENESKHNDEKNKGNDGSSIAGTGSLIGSSGGDDLDISSPSDGRSKSNYQKEHEMAITLSQCFLRKHMLQKRYETLSEFLTKFEMSPEENKLLEYYNFGQEQQQQQYNNMMMSTTVIGPDGQPMQHHIQSQSPESHFDEDSKEGFQFLDVLDKVRKIRAELSKTLLEDNMGGGSGGNMMMMAGGGMDTTNTTQVDGGMSGTSGEPLGASSALRMMEHLAHKQERAYERLYYFLQSYLNLNPSSKLSQSSVPTSSAQQQQQQQQRTFTNPESMMIDDELMEERLSHPFVKRALGSLSCIPLYYSHLLELIAGSRRSEVTRRFLLALTSGYQHAPPIEMRAHDPIGYVGDMLAFVFRAFSVECEIAQGLFRVTSSTNTSSTITGEDDVGDDQEEGIVDGSGTSNNDDGTSTLPSIAKSPQAMVSHSMSGVSRPLKARILQVVSSLARRAEEQQQQSQQSHHHHHHPSDPGSGMHHQTDPSTDLMEFDTASVSARHRITSLYGICGLLLFYNYQMNKTMERMLTKQSSAAAAAASRKQHSDDRIDEGNDDDDVDLDKESDSALEEKRKRNVSAVAQSMMNNPLRVTTLECLREASEAYGASLKVFAAMLPHYSTPHDEIGGSGGGDGETEAQLALILIKDVVKARQSSPGFESHVMDFGFGSNNHMDNDNDNDNDDGATGSTNLHNADLSTSEHVLSMDFLCHSVLDAAVNHSTELHLSDISTLNECVSVARGQQGGNTSDNTANGFLPEESAVQWQTEIELRKNERIDDLVGKATGKMLHDCGLGNVAQAIWSRELASDMTELSLAGPSSTTAGAVTSAMVTYPGLQPDELTKAMKQFDMSLYSPPVPTFGDITDTTLRNTCRSKTSQSVADTYQQIYETIVLSSQGQEEYGDEFLKTAFKHTPEQIKQMLSM